MQSLINNVEQLNNYIEKYKKLCELLTYEEITADKKLCVKLQKEKTLLEPLALNYEHYIVLINNTKEFEEIQTMVTESEKSEIQLELNKNYKNIAELVKTINLQLATLDAVMQNIVLEIVSSKDELSQRLMQMLIKAYSNFCVNNNFEYSVDEQKKSAKLSISGLNAKNLFKNEIGKHIAQCGNVQSECFVYVSDFLKSESVFSVDDVEIVATRSNGAGGQHINTTDSAIKAIHKPTGIVATCQNERSQLQNKNIAIAELKKRVEQFYESANESVIAQQRKKQFKLICKSKPLRVYDFDLNQIVSNKNETKNITNFVLGEIL